MCVAHSTHTAACVLYSTCHQMLCPSEVSGEGFSQLPSTLPLSIWATGVCLSFHHCGSALRILFGKGAQESVFEWVFMIEALFLSFFFHCQDDDF